MVLRLPVEWLESISRCYLIILVYWILALKMGNMLCCAKATEQKGNLKTIQMGHGASALDERQRNEDREFEVQEAVAPVLKSQKKHEKVLVIGRVKTPELPNQHQHEFSQRENSGLEKRSKSIFPFLDSNREMEEAELERMEESRREREEADRRFNERQMTLAIQRNKIVNNYHVQSTMIKEEVSAELSRITDQSSRAAASFEDKLRIAEEERERLIDEMRNKRRAQMAMLVRYLLQTYLSNEAEAEWSQKLSSLRKVHDPVQLHFTTLHAFILDQIKNGDLSLAVPYEHAMEQIEKLKYELREERTTMEDAVLDMQEFKIDHPQAKFLTDIEESAMGVLESATILLSKVAEVEFEMNSIDHTVSLALLNDCTYCFEDLEKNVNTIPTVMDLRRKYEK